MEDQKDSNRSQYDTTFKDLFKQPPQQLLGVLIGRRAVALLPVEFASTQKRLPDLVFLLGNQSDTENTNLDLKHPDATGLLDRVPSRLCKDLYRTWFSEHGAA